MGATFTLAREMWVEEPGRKWRQTKKNKSGDKKIVCNKEPTLLLLQVCLEWNEHSN